jgi:hypothetical protein
MISDIPLWIMISVAIILVIAIAFLFPRVRGQAKAISAAIKGLLKSLPGKLLPLAIARRWWLWIAFLAVGSAWLTDGRQPALRVAHGIPQGAILDTGDIIVGRGLSLADRPLKQGDPITSRNLVDYEGGMVPRGSRLSFAKIESHSSAAIIASRHQGWICPPNGEGRPVAVTAVTCFRGEGACYATIAYPSAFEALVGAGKGRGLFAEPCRTN